MAKFEREHETFWKFYVVEVLNELLVEREYHQVDAHSAQEAVDYVVREIIRDSNDYTVINVFVESSETWEA